MKQIKTYVDFKLEVIENSKTTTQVILFEPIYKVIVNSVERRTTAVAFFNHKNRGTQDYVSIYEFRYDLTGKETINRLTPRSQEDFSPNLRDYNIFLLTEEEAEPYLKKIFTEAL